MQVAGSGCSRPIMSYHPEEDHRRSIRLLGYDYSQPGAYFVTICTQGRVCLFGEVVDEDVRLSRFGLIVADCWENFSDHFASVDPDKFLVMPNHIHGVLNIVQNRRGTACRAPTVRAQLFGQSRRHSLPTIIRSFKSAVTQRVNQSRGTPETTVWQRDYYEHVIRGARELETIRQYIVDNPAKWAEDPENPGNLR